MSSFQPVEGRSAREVPTRLLVVQEEERPPVDIHDEEMVMSFPHLVVREVIALLTLSLVIVLVSIFFNAPLEELANPLKTPNPAKAPWYFLGLQELLHYYPPVISGVIMPGLVLLALAIIPYFDINLKREAFWEGSRSGKVMALLVTVAALTVIFYYTGAHPVWPVIVPIWIVAAVMLLPALLGTGSGWLRWLSTRSLPFWIFALFLFWTVVLTVIGTFFRGPGWSFTLPWVDGIY